MEFSYFYTGNTLRRVNMLLPYYLHLSNCNPQRSNRELQARLKESQSKSEWNLHVTGENDSVSW